MENLPPSGLGNPVAGVLFVFRALDTLLEKVVLLLALLGVWSLAPDHAWGGTPGLQVYARPDPTLIFLAQLLPPVGIVFGIYMCWVGAKDPGGAFQGGTVLAAMWLLVIVAGLQKAPAIGRLWLRGLLVTGPVLFLVDWPCWMGICRRISGLPGGLRQTADCRRGKPLSRCRSLWRLACWPQDRRYGHHSNERGNAVRLVWRSAGGHRTVRVHHESRSRYARSLHSICSGSVCVSAVRCDRQGGGSGRARR